MKKSNQLVLIIFLLGYLFQFSLYAKTFIPGTRGVWMWGSTLSSQGSQTVVNKLKDNYVNKVFLLVKGTGGTKTSASVLNPFIAEAHAAGIEVHLWYIVGSDAAFVSSHPDAVIYHSPKPGTNNNPYPMTGDDRVNLLYPGYKNYVMDNIRYFLENFNCDGVHLDVIRYSHLVYSFDPNQLARADSLGVNTQRLLQLFLDNYNSMSGNGFVSMYTAGDSDVVKWVNMRKNVIYEYISTIKDLISQLKPNIELTAAFMPEGAYDPNMGDAYYAQSYSLNSPLLDEILPMSYFNSYGQAPSWLQTVASSAISHVSQNCKISAGYQTFDNVTATQVKQQIQYALDGGSFGAVNFRYGTTTDDQWVVIKEAYKKILDAEPKTVTNEQMLKMAADVCSFMTAKTAVPDTIYTDSTQTTFVSAADFYYMMSYYLGHYGKNNNQPPGTIPILRNISGPVNPGGVQTSNQIKLADILSHGQLDADYIDSCMTVPDYVTVDTVNYNPPAMFWVYARAINWYRNNGIMPNYATVKTCTGPATSWMCGDNVSSVEEKKSNGKISTNFTLRQNYPNPFNPSTKIEFNLPVSGIITLSVYDVLGREVKILINKELNPGTYDIMFDGKGLPSGIYFYKLMSEKNSLVRKMILMK